MSEAERDILQLIPTKEEKEVIAQSLNLHFADFHRDLSERQQIALKRYKGMEYKPLNRFMRGQDVNSLSDEEFDDVTEQKSLILRAFESPIACLPKSVCVYRGLKGEYPDEKLRAGQILTDFAFTSVSLCPEVAQRICHWSFDSSSTMLEIILPEGTPAIWLEPLWDKDEYEILLPPPTFLSVSAIKVVSTTPLRRVVQCQRVNQPQ